VLMSLTTRILPPPLFLFLLSTRPPPRPPPFPYPPLSRSLRPGATRSTCPLPLRCRRRSTRNSRRTAPACPGRRSPGSPGPPADRSEEHTSELQSRENLVCRLLLEKKKTKKRLPTY